LGYIDRAMKKSTLLLSHGGKVDLLGDEGAAILAQSSISGSIDIHRKYLFVVVQNPSMGIEADSYYADHVSSGVHGYEYTDIFMLVYNYFYAMLST
jgi:hypothetical protein